MQSEKLGFFPAWLKRVELRDPDSPLQGPLVPGHPSAEAGPGGLGLPRDPAGVPRAAELHRARQAQGETAGPPEYGNGSATRGGQGRADLSEWDGERAQKFCFLPLRSPAQLPASEGQLLQEGCSLSGPSEFLPPHWVVTG